MDKMEFRLKDRRFMAKVERVLAETVVHRRQFKIRDGVWPFVVFGPDADGNAVIRVGSAEQARIHKIPVYIATIGGPHVSDSEGLPIEELAGGDIPDELVGMKVFHLSPMRPLLVNTKRVGSRLDKRVPDELMEFYKGNDSAVIETPDEAYWALSVLKYLDEVDRFLPGPVLADFYSKLGVIPKSHYVN